MWLIWVNFQLLPYFIFSSTYREILKMNVLPLKICVTGWGGVCTATDFLPLCLLFRSGKHILSTSKKFATRGLYGFLKNPSPYIQNRYISGCKCFGLYKGPVVSRYDEEPKNAMRHARI